MNDTPGTYADTKKRWLDWFNEKVETLAVLRAHKQGAAEDLEETMRGAREAYGIAALEKSLADARSSERMCENEIRTRALEFYHLYRTKAVNDYVAVRVRREVNIIDEEQAHEWCRTHMPEALAIDRQVLAHLILAMPSDRVPECVKIEEIPVATISARLLDLVNDARAFLPGDVKAEPPPPSIPARKEWVETPPVIVTDDEKESPEDTA